MNTRAFVMTLICLLATASIASSALAKTVYVCRDIAGHTYRLSVPQVGSLGIECEAIEQPKPVSENVARPPAVLPAGALVSRAFEAAPNIKNEWDGQPPHTLNRTAAQRIEAVSPFESELRAAAQRHGHDLNLLKAVVYVESRFDSRAVSPKGAIGLMQVMPATALDMGLAAPRVGLFDPKSNLEFGARYLRKLLDTFNGSPELALAAYNAGPGAVIRYGHAIPPFRETKSYVEKVRIRYVQLREQAITQ